MIHTPNLIRALALLCVLVLAACAGSTTGQDNPTALPTALPPTEPPVDTLPTNDEGIPLVARVNGTEITLPEFQRALARRQAEMNAADPDALEASVLEALIEQALIEQEAANRNITVSDEELQTQLADYISLAGGEEAWQQWLQENLLSQEEFQEDLRESIITQRVLEQVTQSLLGNLPHVHARHILVATEAEANAVMGRLQAGEDFAAVAAAVSRDVTTRDQGGDLGWFTHDELLEPALADVAFSLEPGQIAGPVPTRLGYHIIQTMERGERPVPAEKQADLAQVMFENWIQSLLDQATVERYF